jgi:2-dehydro-3-deoxy-D-arabinonate dehydratase
MRLVQFHLPTKGKRVGVLEGERVVDITDEAVSVLALVELAVAQKQSLDTIAHKALERARQRGAETVAWSELQNPPAPEKPHLLLPLDAPEVWGAGVTYKRSAVERDEDSQTDIYTDPNCFSKRPFPAVRPPSAKSASAATPPSRRPNLKSLSSSVTATNPSPSPFATM